MRRANAQLLAQALACLPEPEQGLASLPRLIHMTTRDKQALAPPIAANLDHIRQQNPAWSLTLYDDQDIAAFIQAHYGSAVLALWQRLSPRYGAARADLFRYLCVYRLGGLYLDLKSTTTRALDDWLHEDDRFILSQWDNGPQGKYSDWGLDPRVGHVAGGEYQQWFVAASAGHPFLRAVIERVLRNIAALGALPPQWGKRGTLLVTGPVAYTLAIEPLRGRHPCRAIDVEREGGLRYSIYDDENAHQGLQVHHYSRQTEPMVALSPLELRVFALAQGLMLRGERVRALATRVGAGLARRLRRP